MSDASPVKRRVDVRAITRRYEKRDKPVTISSERPSANASRSAFEPRYLNGSMATQNPSSVRADPESMGADEIGSGVVVDGIITVRSSVRLFSGDFRSSSLSNSIRLCKYF